MHHHHIARQQLCRVDRGYAPVLQDLQGETHAGMGCARCRSCRQQQPRVRPSPCYIERYISRASALLRTRRTCTLQV